MKATKISLWFLLIGLFFLLKTNCLFAKSQDKDFPFQLEYFEDSSNKLHINQVSSANFSPIDERGILNFGISKSTYWIKLKTQKKLYTKGLILYLDQSRFQISDFFILQPDTHTFKKISLNIADNLSYKKHQGISYSLPNTIDTNEILYLKLKAQEAFISRIAVLNNSDLLSNFSLKDIIFGLYSGIMIVMFFYNLFLFVAVRDKSYIFYIFYILFTWLSQITIQGYQVNFIWDFFQGIDKYSVFIFSSISLFFACYFTISFLNTKIFAPVSHKTLIIYSYLIILNLLIGFIIEKHLTFFILQIFIVLGVVIALATSYYIYYKKHFKPAGYYLIAWSVLLLGVVFFIFKDHGIIPYNNFTTYLMQLASAIEVILLSFALADKINFFKKENEIAQAQALNASLENQRLVNEQNIVLEQKVKERTEELEDTNNSLNQALIDLKEAQSQLVDAEKMVALGQLTAGIAHEINNPINFVTSNIKPLQLDFDDLSEVIKRYGNIDPKGDIESQLKEIEAYKKEIDLDYLNTEIQNLLSGINEGAKRTAEIIRSLRNFSRLDEGDTKAVDLNEGLESTLVLIRNTLSFNIEVVKELGNLPKVDCMPGKINQVFMNLISNAIQAIKAKEVQNEKEYLTVKSWYENQQVKISIKDSGTGMTEEVKHRIFEPFFTTKDIGEGTGLGLSIVFSIIEKHKGNIEVNSAPGEGTEFVLTLPVSNQ